MKKMEGKVVLITGGARGIGYGIAKAFAEEGANIVITGRTASTLIEARENLKQIMALRPCLSLRMAVTRRL